jgi:tryptophanyl-tRNA synthetase
MDLQEPTRKMSKSEASVAGTVFILEEPSAVARKIKRAVTDTDTEVRFDPDSKPGVSNLLSILGACTGESPVDVASRYTQYGPLKADTADAVTELLQPIQDRYRELAADRGTVAKILDQGADKAQGLASVTLERAKRNIGLVLRGEG